MEKLKLSPDTLLALAAIVISLAGVYLQYFRVNRDLAVQVVESRISGPSPDEDIIGWYRAQILFTNYGQRDEIILNWNMTANGDQMSFCGFARNNETIVLQPNTAKLVVIEPPIESMKNCNLDFKNIVGQLQVRYINSKGYIAESSVTFSGSYDENEGGEIAFGPNFKDTFRMVLH